MREQKKYPGRTLDQLKHRKLLGAAEAAVAKSRPTRGYETLVEADLEDLSYEQIVVDHPDEFTPRAQWFSRKTVGLPNRWPEAPADPEGQRSPLMVVAYKSLSESAPPVVGAFVAADNVDIEVTLKKSEPPAHDRWDPEDKRQ